MTATRDLTARARIRSTAMALFAQRGFAGTSIRDIAAAADVSPALVFHHFDSKAGLRAEIDTELLEHMRARLVDRREAPVAEPRVQLLRRLETIADTAREAPEVIEYLARSLMEGSDTSASLFDGMFRYMVADLDELQARGVLRPTDDTASRALLLLFLELGPLLLRDYLGTALEAPPFAPASIDRWVRACTDLLSHGVLDTGEAE